jgi:hypothetical protein
MLNDKLKLTNESSEKGQMQFSDEAKSIVDGIRKELKDKVKPTSEKAAQSPEKAENKKTK